MADISVLLTEGELVLIICFNRFRRIIPVWVSGKFAPLSHSTHSIPHSLFRSPQSSLGLFLLGLSWSLALTNSVAMSQSVTFAVGTLSPLGAALRSTTSKWYRSPL